MIIEILLFFAGLSLEWVIDFIRDWRTANRLVEEEAYWNEQEDFLDYTERRTGVSNIIVGTYSTLLSPGIRKDMSWEDSPWP